VDPDPAVVRSGLLDVLAERHGLLRLDAEEEYLTTDQLPGTGLATSFKVEAVLPAGVRELRRNLRQQPAHHYEIKCRRLAIDVEDVRRQLPTGDAPPCAVIFCRIAGRARAVIGRRVSPVG
jgi:hypothetical protein